MKKIYLTLLAILCCMVSAHAQTFEVDGITYSVTSQTTEESQGEVEVKGGIITEEVIIPESVTYNDMKYAVTSIGSRAFQGRYDSEFCTKKYVIPGTVKSIGDNAFYDNYYLEEIVFNEGLEIIGVAAFAFNFALKEIRLPSTILSIDDSGFLTDEYSDIPVYCPASRPPDIHSKAFEGRTTGSLHVIPTDVDAYREAENWKNFSEIVGDIILTDRCYTPVITCDNNILSMSCMTEGATIYYTTDGSKPDESSICYTSPISYDSNQIIRVIAIAEGYENSSVRNFYDKEQVEKIEEQGVLYTLQTANDDFYYSATGHSDNLNSEIIIHENLNGLPVTSIGDYAFQNCSGLTSVTIPNSVTSIGNYAFYRCTGLTSVTIPNSVIFGRGVFYDCNIKEARVVVLDYYRFRNYTEELYGTCQLIDTDGNEITEYIIPEDVNMIPENAFLNCNGLSSITIPESVTSIGYSSFNGCGGLTSVTIPSGVASIGDFAFNYCSNLTSITIPGSVTFIGDAAFYGCSLISVKVENPIPVTITKYTFSNRANATLYVPKGSGATYLAADYWKEFKEIVDMGQSIIFADANVKAICVSNWDKNEDGELSFEEATAVERFEEIFKDNNTITSFEELQFFTGLIKIDDYAFNNCSSLTSITIPKSVISLGNHAFDGSSSLTSITIPENITSIANYAFSGCASLASVSIPENLTSIGENAFYECDKLTSITIPATVTEIGEDAFNDCRSLTTVEVKNPIPVSITQNTFSNRINAILYVPTGSSAAYLAADYWKEFKEIIALEDIISFADANVKAICVSKWDTNKDGELSYAEAAAVTSLETAFSNNSSITSFNELQYFTGLKTIGAEAFFNCQNLSSITIPNSVTTIGERAFMCYERRYSKLTSVILGNQLTTIGEYAFHNCNSLPSITIPNSVTSIGRCAFIYCSSLNSINLSNQLTTIEASTFGACASLSSIAIPESVTSIGNSAFSGCSGLLSINIPNSVTSIDDYAFMNCSSLISLTIPNGVISLGNSAFNGCSSLNTIVLSEQLTSIEKYTFSRCTGLLSITIPNSVTTIGENAFNLCSGLTSIILSDQLTAIGASALQKCTSLASITLPKSLNSIGDYAFSGCNGLTIVTSEIVSPFAINAFSSFDATLVVPKGSRAAYKNVSGWGFPFIFEEGETHEREVTDEQGVQYSLKYTDDGSYFYSVTGHSDELKEDIVIPEELNGCPVKTIEANVFQCCTSLSSVTIPSSVTAIGASAFSGCSGLTMITSEIASPFAINAFSSFDATLVVPKGSRAAYKNVSGWNFAFIYEDGETIYERENTDEQGLYYTLKQADDDSFYYMVTGHSDELDTEVIIPANLDGFPVKTIEDAVFSDCTSLSSIVIHRSMTTIGNSAFVGCSCLQSITIPNSVTTIGNSAFKGCSSLQSITIPNSVMTIGNRIFENCSSLTSVKIGNSVRSIGESAFSQCSSLTSINIPNSVTSIGEFAFVDCKSLTSIIIPNSVTSLGKYAFFRCENLITAVLSNQLTIIEEATFWACSNLSSITIPNGVTTIGGWAFSSCSNLTSITMGSRLTTIGENAFGYSRSVNDLKVVVIDYSEFCNNNIVGLINGLFPNAPIQLIDCDGNEIAQYIIPTGVTSIGESAFINCRRLTSIVIPSSVTDIESKAFQNCSTLSSVIMQDGVTSIGDYAFKGCSSLTTVKLPESLTTMGSDVFPSSMKFIELPNSFTVIPENLFINNSFQYIKLGNNVKSIGKNAFGSINPVIKIDAPTPPTIVSNAFPNTSYLSNINVIVPDATAETTFRKAAVWKEMTFSNQDNIAEVTVDTPGDLSFELITDCNMMPAKVVGLKVNGTINADDFTQMLVNMKSLLRLDLSDCDITEIPAEALSGKTQLQELTLPTKLQTIGQNAFSDCVGLRKLSPQAGLQNIGQSAFSGCTSLQELNLQAQTIEQSAFQGCTGLLELNLQTQTIGKGAFFSCTSLQNIDLQAQSIGQNAFSNCSGLTKLNLQAGLQTIDQSAFEGCGSLTGLLELPSTVTSIGTNAFVSTKFTSVKLPSALNTIEDYAFYNVPIKQQLVLSNKVNSVGNSAFAGTKIEGLVIPASVKSIGDNAFAGTPIQGHVTIPDGVTYLGTGAFRNSQLSTVFLPNSITTLSEGLFQGCPNLDLVYVPDNYTGLSASAFDGCGALTIIRLSANLTSMGEYALQNTPLEYVKIPSEVEVLPKGVLKNCKNLESLTLPANLKSVEAEALTGCTGLRNMSVEAITPPVIKGMNAISGINTDLCLISIPTQAIKAYILADYWGQFVQMRNDIAVETSGNGEIGFESVVEDEDEDSPNLRPSYARGRRRVSELASEEESMTYANNGSSVYVPQQGQVRFYIIPAEGEHIVSATLNGEDIMPYIVDDVYVATADKRNAKLVVVFSNEGQGDVVQAGDVNGDGDIDIVDVTSTIGYVIHQVPTNFIFKAADVNNDGTVDIVDVTSIIDMIINKGKNVKEFMNEFEGHDPQ